MYTISALIFRPGRGAVLIHNQLKNGSKTLVPVPKCMNLNWFLRSSYDFNSNMISSNSITVQVNHEFDQFWSGPQWDLIVCTLKVWLPFPFFSVSRPTRIDAPLFATPCNFRCSKILFKLLLNFKIKGKY